MRSQREILRHQRLMIAGPIDRRSIVDRIAGTMDSFVIPIPFMGITNVGKSYRWRWERVISAHVPPPPPPSPGARREFYSILVDTHILPHFVSYTASHWQRRRDDCLRIYRQWTCIFPKTRVSKFDKWDTLPKSHNPKDWVAWHNLPKYWKRIIFPKNRSLENWMLRDNLSKYWKREIISQSYAICRKIIIPKTEYRDTISQNVIFPKCWKRAVFPKNHSPENWVTFRRIVPLF